MAFIRFLVWTFICIGLGIFMASYEIGGKTPVKHLQQVWRDAPLDKVRKLVSSPSSTPTEHHSDEDRAAVNRMLVKRNK